ncbi:MAG: hypothetical protein HQ501_11795 [Rhodospirillales bacterium]|nr:hypothetical protein [Rhodospirillales bacterium]
MTTASDIYRTAHLLIDAYGEMAPVGAAIKADQCQVAGDETGRTVWLKVADAVDELMDDETIPPNATIN